MVKVTAKVTRLRNSTFTLPVLETLFVLPEWRPDVDSDSIQPVQPVGSITHNTIVLLCQQPGRCAGAGAAAVPVAKAETRWRC